MFEGVATAHTCAHLTSDAGTSLGRHCSTPHSSQSSSCGSAHLHFVGNVHASVRASGIEKERSSHRFCHFSRVGRSRWQVPKLWSVYQDTNFAMGQSLVDQRWLQWDNKLLPALKAGNPEEKIGNFDYIAAVKMFKTNGMTMDQAGHSGASIDRVRGFRNLQEVSKNEVSGEHSLSKDTTKAVVWKPTTTLSLARSETSW